MVVMGGGRESGEVEACGYVELAEVCLGRTPGSKLGI